MLIYAFVRGILGGYLPYVLLFLTAGAIAELILHKTGYGNVKGFTISYVINQVLASVGSTIYPYAIAVKSMEEMAVTDGRQDNINSASNMLLFPRWLILLLCVAAAAFVGASIGKRVVKKHLLSEKEK